MSQILIDASNHTSFEMWLKLVKYIKTLIYIDIKHNLEKDFYCLFTEKLFLCRNKIMAIKKDIIYGLNRKSIKNNYIQIKDIYFYVRNFTL